MADRKTGLPSPAPEQQPGILFDEISMTFYSPRPRIYKMGDEIQVVHHKQHYLNRRKFFISLILPYFLKQRITGG